MCKINPFFFFFSINSHKLKYQNEFSIGTLLLKDTKVKDDQLVSRNEVPITVSNKLYDLTIDCFTSEYLLDGIVSISVPIEVDGVNSTLHFKVGSYLKQQDSKIIFLGDQYTLILER